MTVSAPTPAPADPTVEAVPGATLRVRIRRDGGFQAFTVARRPAQTILDVVTEIQREQDPTLAYRFAILGFIFWTFTLIAGAIWGQPTWGTWWEWDGRLTSMLVLFFLYCGYMALAAAEKERGPDGRAAHA